MTGHPSYIELGVPDVATARTFYAGLLDWQVPDDGPTQVSTSTLGIGMHAGDPSAHFEVFFAVDDLEAALDRVAKLGGRVLGPINESPGFGRWAECADDQGVRFGLRTE